MKSLKKYQIKLLDKVIAEINHIKSKATKAEISKLDFNHFYYNWYEFCIYGQMTGSCTSNRACGLYPKKYKDLILNDTSIKNILKKKNIKKGRDYTPLELFLFMSTKETDKNIIDYLKGNTNILNLEFYNKKI